MTRLTIDNRNMTVDLDRRATDYTTSDLALLHDMHARGYRLSAETQHDVTAAHAYHGKFFDLGFDVASGQATLLKNTAMVRDVIDDSNLRDTLRRLGKD